MAHQPIDPCAPSIPSTWSAGPGPDRSQVGRRPSAFSWTDAAAVGAIVLGTALIRRQTRETFAGRTVLITGGSRGLGFAMARAFAAEGANVAILARSQNQLNRAALWIEAEFGTAPMDLCADIRDHAAAESAVRAVVRRYGRLDVLVNNAGVIQVTPFAHAQEEDFEESLAVHFWGPYFLVRAALPHLLDAHGRVVNIASVGGRISVPHLLPYSVGKFALVGFSEGLHHELAPHGVSVTTVTPHLMRTGSHRNALVRGQHEREAAWFALGSATRLTALGADRAARQILNAARDRRASCTPGLQARLAVLAKTALPETAAAVGTLAASLLPASLPTRAGDIGLRSRDLDLGRVAHLLATDAARRWNQELAPDERSGAHA
ncbi:MAG: SDR family NAD(P)-dependent oxidoreductase [Vicinamibacterales bacterium]